MKIIITFLLTLIFAHSQCQKSVDFYIKDINGQPIKDRGIYLVIIGENYGIGDRHLFIDGNVDVNLPVGTSIRYSIEANTYTCAIQEFDFTVGSGNTNIVRIQLTKIPDKTLVIKGKVLNSRSRKAVRTCGVEINSEKSGNTFTTTTDSLGYFVYSIPNGMDFLPGTKLYINLNSSLYESVDTSFTVEQKQVNDLHVIKLMPKNSNLTYNIKFEASNSIMRSLEIENDSLFIIQSKGPAEFTMLSRYDSIPDDVQFHLTCSGCESFNIQIKRDSLLSKGYSYSLYSKINYTKSVVGITVIPEYSFLFGKSLQKGSSLELKAGIVKFFTLNEKSFSVGLRFSIVPLKLSIINKYITLPGNQDTVISTFRLSNLPELEFAYYFGNPRKNGRYYFMGVLLSRSVQSFISNTSAKEIDEGYPSFNSLSGGITGGCHLNLTSLISFQAAADICYQTLHSIVYQFNYFGRASQSYIASGYFKVGLRLALIANL